MTKLITVFLFFSLLSSLGLATPTQLEKAPISHRLKIVHPYKQTIPHKVILPRMTEEIRLITDLGLLFINVYLNGSGPFVFWLDTGSEITLISKDLSDKLKLPIVGKTKHHIQASNSKKTIDSELAVVDNLSIGNAIFEKAPVYTLDESHKAFELLKNLDVVGIIGMNMFYDITLTLDISKNRFYLQNYFTPDEHSVKLTRLYFSPVIFAKINEKGTTRQYPFMVDSGFNGGIDMPECISESEAHRTSHSLDFFSKVKKGYFKHLKGKLMIGALMFRNPEVRYSAENCNKKRPFGLLGTRFLKDKVISINLKKRLLSIGYSLSEY